MATIHKTSNAALLQLKQCDHNVYVLFFLGEYDEIYYYQVR